LQQRSWTLPPQRESVLPQQQQSPPFLAGSSTGFCRKLRPACGWAGAGSPLELAEEHTHDRREVFSSPRCFEAALLQLGREELRELEAGLVGSKLGSGLGEARPKRSHKGTAESDAMAWIAISRRVRRT